MIDMIIIFKVLIVVYSSDIAYRSKSIANKQS